MKDTTMSTFKNSWLPAAFCAAALAVAGSAQAAVYTGHWDPVYGAPFPDLGWQGNASFFIPDACLANSGWIENINACSGGTMKVLSAEVEFYNLADPMQIVETLSFDPGALVYKMYVEGSELKGVSTAFLGPLQATSSIAGGGAYYFDLKFLESLTSNVAIFHTLGYADPICAYTNPAAGCGMSANLPTITLTVVPEPATFALSLLGLAGLLAFRRRNP